MLVIKRYSGQSFFIGDDVEVKVLGIEGKQVKLGISAPKEVVILRQELMPDAYAQSTNKNIELKSQSEAESNSVNHKKGSY